MNELTVSLGGDQQHLRRLVRLNQTLREAETVHETRTAKIKIERARACADAEAILQDARRGGQKIVRALRAEQQIVDFLWPAGARSKQLLRRRESQVRSTLFPARDECA